MVDPLEEIKRGQRIKAYKKYQEQIESEKKSDENEELGRVGNMMGKRVRKQESADSSVCSLFKKLIKK